MENAKAESQKRNVALFVVQAHDEPIRKEHEAKFTSVVRAEMLKKVNPQHTKGLSSFLPLYIGMRLTLLSKDCVRLGLMKGCTCTLQHIVFAEAEILEQHQVAGHAYHIKYMPTSLLLKAEDCHWT